MVWPFISHIIISAITGALLGAYCIMSFRNCSNDVKAKLFKAYCSSFYGLTTWYSFHVSVKKKLDIAYKKIFRALFNYRREGTTFNMLKHSIDPYSCHERKYLYGFIKRIESCDNLLCAITNSTFYRSSQFFNYCMNVLYMVPNTSWYSIIFI